jgi:TolA-binding protein
LDKVHRSELKHDKFAEQVGHTLEYATDHRSQVVKWGGIAVAALVVILGVYLYVDHQASARSEALTAAMRVQEAQIGPANGSEYVLTFPTVAEKNAAIAKAFTSVMEKYPSSREGLVARFYLGVLNADQGKLAEAETYWKPITEASDADLASQARLSLGQLYDTQGRAADAEKVLRSAVDHPTIMVSKEQAIIALAHAISKTKPDEARKMLEPLRSEHSSAVSRMAITAVGELSQK